MMTSGLGHRGEQTERASALPASLHREDNEWAGEPEWPQG
jgi:hypothetical protein